MSAPDYENMSDDDFINLSSPVGEPAQEDPADPVDPIEPDVQDEPSLFSEDTGSTMEEELDAAAESDDPADDEPVTSEANTQREPVPEIDHTKSNQTSAGQPTEPVSKAAPAAGEGGEAADPAEAETPKAPSAEEAYNQIMKPFKANGKEFTPKDPEEVIRLMQQGANYAKKMQALRPNLRMMKMLENKGLLDEGKLNFLIDINDRNPAAIQKLLHDSKIDPMDIDATEAPKYVPTNHSVSDAQYAFQETLTDLASTSGGKETIDFVNRWDKASKEEIFKDPKILPLINEQRENGIYSRITDELERQKMLGNFVDTPFIHAYKAVGDYLHGRGELIPATPAAATAAPAGGNAAQDSVRTMVETRTASTKAKLANSDRAQAAGSTRSTPSSAPRSFDPFSVSDEEIMRMSLPNS